MTVKSILPYGLRPIPHMEDPARYEARSFEKSNFVEIVSGEKIDVCMQYPVLNMKNAYARCLMRREVAERLYAAAAQLPPGYRFRIWDAWRPFALQHELYEVYSKDIIRDFRLEDTSEEERSAVIRGFVSDPIPDHEVPPAHTTGGAVDLTILDADGNELDMGTGFDAFTEKTRTDYYENEELTSHDDSEGDQSKEYSKLVREHRRMLYHVMTDAGFTNLPSEWWHYDYGDRNWAYFVDHPALYRGVFTKEEINGFAESDK
ncbi:MAG: M15 family metallopeptidase [Lachnospiraceae bacterium]|nr:M15 family metallopeptidase [Lachnospiraceae bacterium]